MIIAGPGTGKTRTLTHRIAVAIIGQGVPAERMAALTFSRRAAEEMREGDQERSLGATGPSPFLAAIDPALLSRVVPVRRPQPDRQLRLL